MSPEFPEHLREEPKYKPSSRPWWREALGMTPFALLFTISAVLDGTSVTGWTFLAIFWASIAAYAVWLYRCERQGRDPRDTRFERWASMHPVLAWVLFATLFATCVGAGIWLRN